MESCPAIAITARDPSTACTATDICPSTFTTCNCWTVGIQHIYANCDPTKEACIRLQQWSSKVRLLSWEKNTRGEWNVLWIVSLDTFYSLPLRNKQMLAVWRRHYGSKIETTTGQEWSWISQSNKGIMVYFCVSCHTEIIIIHRTQVNL